MPHLTLEYSANLSDPDDVGRLCSQLAECLTSITEEGLNVYPVGGIRVRAIPCEAFSVASGRVDNAAFMHAILKIGAGRSEAVKAATGNALFDMIKKHFDLEFLNRGLALSLEISEFSEAGTWKHNNLHGLLKARF
jgi:5-carboxymethyl-2-hydroxymuconate isomerase